MPKKNLRKSKKKSSKKYRKKRYDGIEEVKIPIPKEHEINTNLENLLYNYKCDETKLNNAMEFISSIIHITFDDLLYNIYMMSQKLKRIQEENKDIVYKMIYNSNEIYGSPKAPLLQSNFWISLFVYHSKIINMKYIYSGASRYQQNYFNDYKDKFIQNDIDCIKSRDVEIDNLILFDDMIYSGGQISNKIDLYLDSYTYTLKSI